MDVRVRGDLNPSISGGLEKLLELDKPAAEDAAESVDSRFRAHEKRLFRTEGAEGGPPWQRLSPEYKRRKDRLFAKARAYRRAIAKARGGKVRGSLGAENKVLQLTGDLKRALSEMGGLHIVETFRVGLSWIIRVGASGPPYGRYHEEGDGVPTRHPMQHTEFQRRLYLGDVRRRLIPHLMRRMRVLQAWRRARAA